MADVWLGNNRGSKYGVDHVKLKNNQPEFWDFTFTDMGRHDAPALIDCVHDIIGHAKLITYIGHDQGATQMLYAIQKDQKYWQKRLSGIITI